MLTLKLPNGDVKQVPPGTRPREVAEGIGKRLAQAAVAAKVNGGIVDLGVLEGDATSQALGINGRGQVVGLSSGPNGNRAVLWEGGERTDLNTLVEPGYTGTLLIAGHINDAGVITGSALDGDSGEIVTFVATPIGKQ